MLLAAGRKAQKKGPAQLILRMEALYSSLLVIVALQRCK